MFCGRSKAHWARSGPAAEAPAPFARSVHKTGMRKTFLVCYDICNDKRLAKVHKTMRAFGDLR